MATQQDDDDGGALLLLKHTGTGKYASLTQDHLDHIASRVQDSVIKDRLTYLSTPQPNHLAALRSK